MPRRHRRNRLNPVVITGLVIAGAVVLAFAGLNAGWLKTQSVVMPGMEAPVMQPVIEKPANAPIAVAPQPIAVPAETSKPPAVVMPVVPKPVATETQKPLIPVLVKPVVTETPKPVASPEICDQLSFFSRLLRAAILQPCTKSVPVPAAPPVQVQLNQVPAPGTLPVNAIVPPVAVTLPVAQQPNTQVTAPNPADPNNFPVIPVQPPVSWVTTYLGWLPWISTPQPPVAQPCMACTGPTCPNPTGGPPSGGTTGFFSRTWQSVTNSVAELSRQIRSQAVPSVSNEEVVGINKYSGVKVADLFFYEEVGEPLLKATLRSDWQTILDIHKSNARQACLDALTKGLQSNTDPYFVDAPPDVNRPRLCSSNTPQVVDPPHITKEIEIIPAGFSKPPTVAQLRAYGGTPSFLEKAECEMKFRCNQPITECTDGIDNDSDSKKDTFDPDCHTDGNANNTTTYSPNINSEGIPPAQPPQNLPLQPPPGPLDLPLNDPYLPGGALHDPVNMRRLFDDLKVRYQQEQSINCNYGEPQRTLICGPLLRAVETEYNQWTTLIDAARDRVNQIKRMISDIPWPLRAYCSVGGWFETRCEPYRSLKARLAVEEQAFQQYIPIQASWLPLRNEISTWCLNNQLPQGQFPGL